MPRKKVLLTVTTYPLPSNSYEELVCTAGITSDGDWIRLYPMPLSFITGQKREGKLKSYKYTWIELNLKQRTDDFRPESHSPEDYEFKDLEVYETIGTDSNWSMRKDWCLRNVYTNMDALIQESKEPLNKSLATFKPKEVFGLEIQEDDREWKDEWKELKKQTNLFDTNEDPEKVIKKLPYKFFYKFTDESGKIRRMMIEDWEIGQLYWNCLKHAEGNEAVALEKVKEKYESDFIKNKDLHFFLGTTKQWHKRSKNPFVIIGVFYPKKESQLSIEF